MQTDLADTVVENTNLQRGEKAFQFLERLATLAGVLLSDNENGDLVMATAGTIKSGTALVAGKNIEAARAEFNAAKRYSIYIVKGQAGIGEGNAMNLDGAGGISAAPVGVIQNALYASTSDSAVPRYRPHVTLAESQLTQEQMQARANWQAKFAYGQSLKAIVTLSGFRQDNGALWTPNLMVTVTAPWLYADDDLLIDEIKFRLDERSGHRAELLMGPIEGFAPDPASVRLHKQKIAKSKKGKKGGGGVDWSGAGGIG